MDCKNSKGQILGEVALVMGLIVLILFGALSQMTNFKKIHEKNQFGKGSYEKNIRTR